MKKSVLVFGVTIHIPDYALWQLVLDFTGFCEQFSISVRKCDI